MLLDTIQCLRWPLTRVTEPKGQRDQETAVSTPEVGSVSRHGELGVQCRSHVNYESCLRSCAGGSLSFRYSLLHSFQCRVSIGPMWGRRQRTHSRWHVCRDVPTLREAMRVGTRPGRGAGDSVCRLLLDVSEQTGQLDRAWTLRRQKDSQV